MAQGGSIDFTEAAQLLQLIGREPSEKEIDELCLAIGAHSDEVERALILKHQSIATVLFQYE